MLACLFGEKAVELLMNGERNKIVGLQGNRVVAVDLEESSKRVKPLNLEMFKLARKLTV